MGIVNAQHTANRLDDDEMVPVLVDTPADYYSDPWRLSLIVIVRMDADEKGVSTIYTLGGPQEMNIINESGIWSLVLTSRMMMKKLMSILWTPAANQRPTFGTPNGPLGNH